MAKQATFAQHFNPSSRHASYRLGLIDPSTLAPMTIDPLCDGVFVDAPSFKLLVPGPSDLPTSLLLDTRIQDGATVGYYAHDLDAELEDYVALPARVANWVWSTFSHNVRYGANRSWLVGYILGSLTSLAETDRALALVGIAHLSFLLSLVPSLPHPQLYRALGDVGCYHSQVVCAYRAEVRALKAQGLDFASASRAALADGHCATAPYAGECAPLACESEVA